MIDFSKFENFKTVESSKVTKTGEPALYVTNTASGVRIRFNRALARELELDEKFYKQDNRWLHVVQDTDNIYLGKEIHPDASKMHVSGDVDRPMVYDSNIGSAILKKAKVELKRNKTICFDNIEMDSTKNGVPVAKISF